MLSTVGRAKDLPDRVRALGRTPPLTKAAFRGSRCLRGRNCRLWMMLCHRLRRDRCVVGLVKSCPGLQGSSGVCAGGSIAASPGERDIPTIPRTAGGGRSSWAETTSPARAGRGRSGGGDAAKASACCGRGPRKQPPPKKSTPFFAGIGKSTPLLLKTQSWGGVVGIFPFLLLYLSCASPQELCKSKHSSPLHARGCERGHGPSAAQGRRGCRDAGKGLGKVTFRDRNKSGVHQA